MSGVRLSIVLPVHDEEALLDQAVRGISEALQGSAELVVCENGSRDATLAIARDLERELAEVRVITSPRANYGGAIRDGILAARGEHVVVVNADLWDVEFVRAADEMLATCDVVIASKRHPGSRDERSFGRRALTSAFTVLLNTAFGYDGSDTHGMKGLRREPALRALARCVSSDELLDSELVIRMQREGGSVRELPVRVRELRPSRRSALARVPSTVRDLARLAWALRARP